MFYSTDSTGGADAAVVVGGTGDAGFWGQDCPTEIYCITIDQYKEEMEDVLWMIADRREWREYLKAVWLKALKLKKYSILGQCGSCKLYYRRLLISISGWLARKGYAKKN